jgi:transcriptional regulator with XRE-family HTH domain
MIAFSAFWSKLRDKEYRQAFVSAEVKQALPFQIRALLQSKNLTQAELAQRAGLTQGAVSRAANPDYGNLSLNTLVRIAAGFDVAFVGRFVPYSELWRWLNHLHDETVSVATFAEEDERLRLGSTHSSDDVAVLVAQLKQSLASGVDDTPELSSAGLTVPGSPAHVKALAALSAVPTRQAKAAIWTPDTTPAGTAKSKNAKSFGATAA